MRPGIAWLGGLGLGAGLMYLLDPDKGHSRRTLLRNKAIRGEHLAATKIRHTLTNVRNRTQGVVMETIDRLADLPVPDSLLEDRVRAKLGHFVEHAHPIKVSAREGVVSLEGTVPAAELNGLLKGVSAVRGVVRVDNRLETIGIDDKGVPCCSPGNVTKNLRIPVAIGVLGAMGAYLFFRTREMGEVAAFPGLSEAPPTEMTPDSIAASEAWAGQPDSGHRYAA